MRGTAHYPQRGRAMTATLTAVAQSGYWRVKIAWPNKTPHFFGKFQTKKEAEQWIAGHHWMTEQRQEPDKSADLAADETSELSPPDKSP